MLKNTEGQASAVGVMLAILIILTIISIITLHYIPLWMKEREAHHMNIITNQFCNLQKDINNLIVSGDNTTDISASFTLGVEGFPLLGISGTSGTLEVDPYTSSFRPQNDTKILNITASGRVKFISGNRYYSKQNFIYENSAVLVMQAEGNSLKATPEINIYNISGDAKNESRIALKLVSIQSNKKGTFSGSGTHTVKFRLLCSQDKERSWSEGEKLVLNISSEALNVWEDYLRNTTLASLDKSAYELTKGENYLTLTLNKAKWLGVKFVSVEAKLY